MKRLITVLALIFVGTLTSQNVNFSSFDYGAFIAQPPFDHGLIEKEKNRKITYKDIKGTPYINQEFADVIIKGTNAKAVGRYDAFKNNFEILSPNNKLFTINKLVGSTVTFKKTNTVYVVLKVSNEKKFFRLMGKNDESMLLAYSKKIIVGGIESKNSYETYREPFFKDNNTRFYLSYDGKKAEKIPHKLNKFSALFKVDQKKLSNYINKHQLSLKKEKDILNIFNSMSLLR